MATQHNIVQFLPLNEIQHIQRVGVQIDLLGEQVRALTNAGEGGCEYFVSLFL